MGHRVYYFFNILDIFNISNFYSIYSTFIEYIEFVWLLTDYAVILLFLMLFLWQMKDTSYNQQTP